MAGIAAAALVLTTARPSSADPVCASVWVDQQNAPTTTYVVGPATCVTTPWAKLWSGGAEYEQPTPIVGDVTGAGASVTVPAPV